MLRAERGCERAFEAEEYREAAAQLMPTPPGLYGVSHPTRCGRSTAGDEVSVDGVDLNPRPFEGQRRPAGARNVTLLDCAEEEPRFQLDHRGPCHPPRTVLPAKTRPRRRRTRLRLVEPIRQQRERGHAQSGLGGHQLDPV